MIRAPEIFAPSRSAYRSALAAAGFFVLAAGDFVRYTLSWWGWGAAVVVFVALGIRELIRERPPVRHLPLLLGATLALMALSTAWSAYPAETLLGFTATLATTIFAIFLSLCLTWSELVDAIAAATRIALALSLAFELFVATIIREPVLPWWVDYSHIDQIPMAFYWSRDLLFEGGRIQGIVGNANILAMIALIGLIAGAARLASGRGTRVEFAIWTAIGTLVLALTRSSTVLIAAAAVAVVAAVAWWARRGSGPRRVVAAVGLLAAGGIGAAGAIVFRESLLRILGKSSDLTNRLDIWADVTQLALERPALGWGWISYWAPWVKPFDDLAVIRGVTYLQAHNAWLDIFLQLGVVGLVVLGLFALTTLVRSWVFALDGPPGSALLPLALMTALLVHSLAESRLLIEVGWAVLVIVSIRTATQRWERR